MFFSFLFFLVDISGDGSSREAREFRNEGPDEEEGAKGAAVAKEKG